MVLNPSNEKQQFGTAGVEGINALVTAKLHASATIVTERQPVNYT